MLIAESSSFHYSLAVFAINRECNCETQTVLEISGRTSIFIDVKPFMRCIREPASQTPKNQHLSHDDLDGHIDSICTVSKGVGFSG